MNNRICVSIGKENIEEAVEQATAAQELADVIEIRLDMLSDRRVEPFIERIDAPLLFTNRADWEGGAYQGSEEERLDLLIHAASSGAAYVDLELEAPADSWGKLLIKCETLDTKTICSWHHFNATPSQAELGKILEGVMHSGADIGKIVTTAKDHFDVLRLLNLQKIATRKNFPLIAFCMGEQGIISRVATCFLGGYMTYCAADNGDIVAPGQLSVAAMRTIFLQMKW